ncbi:MAG: hypothetical protein JWL61_1910 [Gemmatimonadetes bacterium]|nr:hypothetical protein [Gemmatimonadota bacterium]
MTAVRRRWLRVVALVAFATLLIAFLRTVDWRAAAAAARSADIGLLVLALVANQLSLALKAVRWWVFLRPLGVRSLWLVVRATFAGASLNNLVVAQGGEGARVILVSRATGVSSARVAAALALERVLDAVSYLTLLVAAAWMMDLPEMLLRWRTAASIALGVVVAALMVLGFSRNSAAGVDAARGRIRAYAQRFTSSASDLATPARLIIALVLSLGAWALQVATYHTVARAAHLSISLSGSIAALLAIGISFLLRATPGNVGVFQLIYAVTARGFGIAEGPAVAAALLIQTIQVIPTVAIGTVMAHGLLGRDRDDERIAKLSRPL